MQAYFIALEETTLTRIKFYKGEAVNGLNSFQNGGALWVSGPTLVLNKCYFHWNRSDGHGGAIYVYSGRVTLHGTTFSGAFNTDATTNHHRVAHLNTDFLTHIHCRKHHFKLGR